MMDSLSQITVQQFAVRILGRAAQNTAAFFGADIRTAFTGVATIALGLLLFYAARGTAATRDEAQKAIILTLLPSALFVTGLFLVNLLLAPYQIYRSENEAATRALDAQQQQANTIQGENEQLRQSIQTKRHYFEVTEPAYENAWAVTMAFWEWRKSLGTEGGKLLITADKDAAALRLAGAFTQFAVRGSNFGNGNLQNIGIKPEDTEAIEQTASMDGTLVIHARPEVKGVLPLIDALGPKVVRVERSFKMPETPTPLPPNVLWLHFGKGVRWSSEYWEEQKHKVK